MNILKNYLMPVDHKNPIAMNLVSCIAWQVEQAKQGQDIALDFPLPGIRNGRKIKVIKSIKKFL